MGCGFGLPLQDIDETTNTDFITDHTLHHHADSV
jgi:predicted butyrate kinase (DUF1464 family)